jgi:hypothetical protein
MTKKSNRMAWLVGGLVAAGAAVVAGVTYFSSKPSSSSSNPPTVTKAWKLATTLNPGDPIRVSFPVGMNATLDILKAALQASVTAGQLGAFNVYSPGDVLPTDWPKDDTDVATVPNVGTTAKSYKAETTWSGPQIPTANFPINPVKIWSLQ